MSAPANHKNVRSGSTAYDSNRTALSAPLIRQYLLELLSDFESLAASTREAVYRGNDNLARVHLDQIRLVGKEIMRSVNELRNAEGVP